MSKQNIQYTSIIVYYEKKTCLQNWNKKKHHMEWVSNCRITNTKWAISQLSHGENTSHSMKTRWCPLCTKTNAELGFRSASSLKQHIAGRHIAQFGRIILITSYPVFHFSPWCCVLSGKATNIIFLSCNQYICCTHMPYE